MECVFIKLDFLKTFIKLGWFNIKTYNIHSKLIHCKLKVLDVFNLLNMLSGGWGLPVRPLGPQPGPASTAAHRGSHLSGSLGGTTCPKLLYLSDTVRVLVCVLRCLKDHHNLLHHSSLFEENLRFGLKLLTLAADLRNY